MPGRKAPAARKQKGAPKTKPAAHPTPAPVRPAAAAPAAVPSAKEITQRDLADRLGITTRTVRNLHVEGIPHTGEGAAVRYPWPAARVWYTDRIDRQAAERNRPTDMFKLQIQKETLNIRRQELELADALGQVVPTTVYEERVDDLCTRLRAPINALTSTWALRFQAAGVEYAANVRVCDDLTAALLRALQGAGDGDGDDFDGFGADPDAAHAAHPGDDDDDRRADPA